jgi:UDP-N-acetylmuramoylalanine--D-glutamate ligase
MKDFKGKKIAIVGKGIEGKSSEEFFKKHGALITVLDKDQGEDYLKDLDKYDLIVRSPGVNLSKLEVQASREKITSQTKIFFDLSSAKIIGVTGTKGKGTTSSLIYEMLLKEGRDAYLVGNIGKPALDILDNLNDQSIVVYELSSFQLEDLKKSPHIAVMLMVTSEHLDYHKDTQAYIDAKRNIFKYQTYDDFAIVNRDYPSSNESDVHTQGKVYQTSREQEVLDEGCFVSGNSVVLRLNGEEEEVVKTNEIALLGRHNLENVCAAVLAARLEGVKYKNISDVLKTFKGLEHRLELVDTVMGVRYYDDSFSTTPETAIAAIDAFDDPLILILGGSTKNSDFSELGKIISDNENIKAIVGIGEEWNRIKQEIKNTKSKFAIIEGAKDMDTVVKAASKIAEVEDVVLLSPACASFGMFKNYKDRGEQFKKAVKNLRENLN